MRELILQTWSNLSANRLRSFLTMFGIIWGVISIVILSSVSEGFQRGNDAVFREFGKNILIINSGRTSMQAGGERAGRFIRLNLGDVYALKERSKMLEFVSPEIMGQVSAKSPFNSSSVGVSGVWPVFQHIRTIETDRGRLMSEADNEQARRVVVIGFDVSKQLFADRDPIGAQITLNSIPYSVVGRIRNKDQDSSYSSRDNERIFIPYEAMRKDFPLTGNLTTADSLSKIIATPYDHVTEELRRMSEQGGKSIFSGTGPVESEVRAILGPLHNFDPRDSEAIPIWNTAVSSVMFSKVMKSMGEFFIAVSIITLALGGIGVMNIMLIAVKERTKEIGVRKALGATSRNIQWQFLSEGLFLTLLSGALGLALGLGLCSLVNLLPMPARFSGMIFTWRMAAFSISALVVVGVLASTYPARRAAEMQPIEALRYEM
ncbi:MAG TPA: ABC transporter permease [Blastocatellia bacterium]|jgi:putative ABC transport system permease protein|nr:ABC transporter permease [Blastocatellia bacterium]